MQPLFKIHVWLTFAIIFLPFKHLVANFVVIILTANFFLMVYQAVNIQRSCLTVDVWETVKCWSYMLAKIGMELLSGIVFTVLLETIYIRCFSLERITVKN